jgi:hypothetical protein
MLKAKILGKPYAGKLHVRFDEGEEEAKVRKCGLTLYRLPSSFYSTGEIEGSGPPRHKDTKKSLKCPKYNLMELQLDFLVTPKSP